MTLLMNIISLTSYPLLQKKVQESKLSLDTWARRASLHGTNLLDTITPQN